MPAGMLEIWTGSVVLYVAMSPLLREYNTRLQGLQDCYFVL